VLLWRQRRLPRPTPRPRRHSSTTSQRHGA
jgi:hypothetical protein